MGVLDGKTALITGGTSGVGRVAASLFAEAGAKVVVVGRSAERGAEVEAEVRAKGGSATFISADITSEKDVARLMEEASAILGKVDAAFFNAGVTSSGARIAEMTLEDFSGSIAINLTSAFLCMKYVIPHLTSPGGAVVFTSSITSVIGSPTRAAYTAAKGGLNAFARAAAMEMAPKGIRVNTVCPAGIMTPMVDAYAERTAHLYGSKEAALAAGHARHPLGRMSDPEDVARVALFLCSEAAAMVTGHLLPVDGGLSAGTAQQF